MLCLPVTVDVTVTVKGQDAVWALAVFHHNGSVAHSKKKRRLPAITVTRANVRTQKHGLSRYLRVGKINDFFLIGMRPI